MPLINLTDGKFKTNVKLHFLPKVLLDCEILHQSW